jgi:hypothetical protein
MTEKCYNQGCAIYSPGRFESGIRAGVLLMKSQQRRTQVILPEITPLWTG